MKHKGLATRDCFNVFRSSAHIFYHAPNSCISGKRMNEYLASGLLGLVQGLTEFLPVSSSGHLIIASSLMGFGGERINTFEVVIQFGSILAVLFLYWPRFKGLLLPEPGKAGGFSGFRGLWLLFLTSLPASAVGALGHGFIKAHFFNPVSVSLALAVGALFILFAESKKRPVETLSIDAITPGMALGIGFFQCLSLWPGFSRSTSTIMGAMILGAGRGVAAEYSFLAAVPIMIGATGFTLYASADALNFSDIPFFALGTLVSFLSALLAIKVLVGLVSKISFRPFALYRLIIAPVVFYVFTAA